MAEPLKYHYSIPYIKTVAEAIKAVYPHFDSTGFVSSVLDDHWELKELKERMRHISSTLHDYLPTSYSESVELLMQAAPRMKGYCKSSGFLDMFFPDFTERYGHDDWECSMLALEVFTQYSSSEFAVRSFIVKDSVRMMKQMGQWAEHENYHVRRLASEGCRPRLPWAGALPEFKQDPSPILPILHQLKNDSEEYVRRSVANNLNDIAKDHPDIVITIARQWLGDNRNTDRLIKHGCRTLLKSARPEALAIFGFADTQNVTINMLSLDKDPIHIGQDAVFYCELTVKRAGRLRLEYGIDYVKSNGSLSRKIFQIKEGDYQAGDVSLRKKHSFKQMTTRTHYEGQHRLALIVNGVECASVRFFLQL